MTVTRRELTLTGWLFALALLFVGAGVWPTFWPWFLLIGVAATLEAVFLLAGQRTLSQRYWTLTGRARVIVSVIAAVGLIVLWGHLALGWFR